MCLRHGLNNRCGGVQPLSHGCAVPAPLTQGSPIGLYRLRAPLCKGGRLRAPPVAEEASKKEGQRSKFCERMRAKNFGHRNRGWRAAPEGLCPCAARTAGRARQAITHKVRIPPLAVPVLHPEFAARCGHRALRRGTGACAEFAARGGVRKALAFLGEIWYNTQTCFDKIPKNPRIPNKTCGNGEKRRELCELH